MGLLLASKKGFGMLAVEFVSKEEGLEKYTVRSSATNGKEVIVKN